MLHRAAKFAIASTAVGAVITTAGIVVVVRHIRRKKRRRGAFLSNKTRKTITETLEVAGEDLPGGALGTSLYKRHIQGLSDKRLLTLYAAVKVGEYLRDAGLDPQSITPEQLELIRARFGKDQAREGHDREGVLAKLLSLDEQDARRLLVAALGILVLL